MPKTTRYLTNQVQADLARKMVFLGGPRQVGKTTLARSLPEGGSGYLNWDVTSHREQILKNRLPVASLWVLDEIHKYRFWRRFVKGLFDARLPGQKILVTGSARLDLYRYGGDSLQGRYHYLRLHPLSVAELGLKRPSDFKDLLQFSGFPEPFFGRSEVEARRWSRDYRDRLIHGDVTSLERVQDLGTMELMVTRLPALVGSPLSINGVREDLQVAHRTVANWLDILERLYSVFRLAPFGAPKLRAVRKEQKHYHFDWSLVPGEPARLENLVASHLLKWVHFEQDTKGRDLELRYFRDTDGREVDFVVTEGKHLILMVEAKWNDTEIDRGLRYLKERFKGADAWQVSGVGASDYMSREGIRVAPAIEFLKTLV